MIISAVCKSLQIRRYNILQTTLQLLKTDAQEEIQSSDKSAKKENLEGSFIESNKVSILFNN